MPSESRISTAGCPSKNHQGPGRFERRNPQARPVPGMPSPRPGAEQAGWAVRARPSAGGPGRNMGQREPGEGGKLQAAAKPEGAAREAHHGKDPGGRHGSACGQCQREHVQTCGAGSGGCCRGCRGQASSCVRASSRAVRSSLAGGMGASRSRSRYWRSRRTAAEHSWHGHGRWLLVRWCLRPKGVGGDLMRRSEDAGDARQGEPVCGPAAGAGPGGPAFPGAWCGRGGSWNARCPV